jgi:DNA-binding transcriptional ArsR family regulator
VSSDDDEGENAGPAPDEAFATLGNETRMAILGALGDSGGPLSFSELHDRVEVADSGQFNYHLDRLVDHFVRRSDEGYELQRAGERVAEAVLSGAVTEAPVLEPTEVDQSCQYCGAPVGVQYREEEVTLFCTECPGIYGEQVGPEDRGLIGTLFLPPAGVEGRTATELVQVAHVWGGLAMISAASCVCPVCSAAIERSVRVCEDHARTDEVCESCGGRYAVGVRVRCTNCIYDRAGAFGAALLANLDLLQFMTAHGINPVDQSSRSVVGAAMDYEEEVVSTEPFEARFTYTVGGDAITLTVDDDLSVVDVSE